MRLLETVESCEVTVQDDNSVTWTARGRVDGDGSGGNVERDPCFQPETSLKVNGVSLNSRKVKFIVVTPEIIRGVAGVVLGCQAYVFYRGVEVAMVVGDVGPHSRLGEMSMAGEDAFNLPDSPIDGGDDLPDISYRILPGIPAEVDGITYPLQPYEE
jgi:hypothetical protein